MSSEALKAPWPEDFRPFEGWEQRKAVACRGLGGERGLTTVQTAPQVRGLENDLTYHISLE
jgi:hypothetical protein